MTHHAQPDQPQRHRASGPGSPAAPAGLLLSRRGAGQRRPPVSCPDLVMQPPALKRPRTPPACRTMKLPGITPEGVILPGRTRFTPQPRLPDRWVLPQLCNRLQRVITLRRGIGRYGGIRGMSAIRETGRIGEGDVRRLWGRRKRCRTAGGSWRGTGRGGGRRPAGARCRCASDSPARTERKTGEPTAVHKSVYKPHAGGPFSVREMASGLGSGSGTAVSFGLRSTRWPGPTCGVRSSGSTASPSLQSVPLRPVYKSVYRRGS